MNKVAAVTGTRAEYGLLYWILKGISEDPGLELQLLVSGMHLSPEFGLTYKEIEADGFPIEEKVELLLSSDTPRGIATSMGLGMVAFAAAYQRLQPDLLLVLGDRFEILAAVAAAVPFRIPVAHIHGGESTVGVIDEQFRHAITKMSHIHFPATEGHARNIVQMGEDPALVYNVGSPAVDSILRLNFMDRVSLAQELEIPADREWGVVTYHPETLSAEGSAAGVQQLMEALGRFREIFWVCTMPNADTENRVISDTIRAYFSHYPERGRLFVSLGRLRYPSLLSHAAVMVGNSSSGIIEAPSFHLPAINIGVRQGGRTRAPNVIDVPTPEASAIVAAIEKGLSREFRDSLREMASPYGEGDASRKIVAVLRESDPQKVLIKHFHPCRSPEERNGQ